MTTAERLQSILDSKSAIAAAITEKGGTLASAAPLSDYAAAVRSIPTGGKEKYPLADLGYDPDGTLATQMDKSLRWMKIFASKTDMSYAFDSVTDAVVLPNFDYANVTAVTSFCRNSGIKYFPPSIVMPKVTSLGSAFQGMQNCDKFGDLSAPLATSAAWAFSGVSFVLIGSLDLPKVTNASTMFRNSSSLVYIKSLNMPAVTNAGGMFYGCSSLLEVRWDVKSVTYSEDCFTGCDDIALWLNWGSWSGCDVNGSGSKAIGTHLLKRFNENQKSLDLRGAKNWGLVSPQSLQHTIDNLPARFYIDGNNFNMVTAGSTCKLLFSPETKAALTDAQKLQITSKNYTIA